MRHHAKITTKDTKQLIATLAFMAGTPFAGMTYYNYIKSSGSSSSIGTTIIAGCAGGTAAAAFAYTAPSVFGTGCLIYAGYSVYQEVTRSEKLV